MPKFSANLTFLYTDLPLLDRFAAAAKSGFKGVEYMSPYEEAKADLAARLRDNGLTQVLLNLPSGNWGGGRARHCDFSRSRRRIPPRRASGDRLCRRA